MPAAPFLELPTDAPTATAIRQWAIGAEQCRWIVADADAGAEALMCGAPAEKRRPFCAEHCARAYMKLEEDEVIEAAEAEAVQADNPEKEEVQ